MNNKEKYDKLYYGLGITFDEDIGDVNSFFDDEFIDYLVNRDEYGIGQLRIALERVDFSNYNLSDPISSRHKSLITFLLNFGINIKPIINNLNNNQYNELANYLKELCDSGGLKNTLLLSTNDISIINSIDMVLDYNSLEYALTSDSIDNDVKKYIFTYQENKDIFINEFNVWNFYRIVDNLNLDESYVEEREYKLKECVYSPNINITDFREILCELICKDSYNNFMLNLEMIYNYCVSEKDIPSDLGVSANYFMLVKDYFKEEDISKIDIDFLMKNYKVIGDFYNKTISMIKSNFNNKLNTRLVNGDIYFVHTEYVSDFEDTDNLKNLYNTRLSHPSKRVSFSLLNSERTGIYHGVNNAVVFGYNQTPDNLAVACLGDARTAQSRIWTRGSYLSVDDYLLKSSCSHNELLYEGVDEVILPDYLISFHDEATELEQKIANEFNIPIKHLKYNSLGTDSLLPDAEYKYHYNKIVYITNYLNMAKTMC